ncbi:GntR family transcriptional regulator [Ligilactobacillus ceti]|nr:GntR family transcriptional regulator [Ligilactobacillus ceti]
MPIEFTNGKPIYQQIAIQIENAIFTGVYQEEEQIPSTTEYSQKLHINPATVLKGMNMLVNKGLLQKKRGLGMFVKQGAREQIVLERRAAFYQDYLVPLLKEAEYLELTQADLIAMLQQEEREQDDV